MIMLWAGGLGLRFWQGQYILFFVTTSRPAIGSTQSPVQWVPVALSMGIKQMVHEADHSYKNALHFTNEKVTVSDMHSLSSGLSV
jgi:hypothetical protein